jgi:hypothetical protein
MNIHVLAEVLSNAFRDDFPQTWMDAEKLFLKYIVPSLKSFQINPVMLMLLIKMLPIPCGDDFIPIHQTIAG